MTSFDPEKERLQTKEDFRIGQVPAAPTKMHPAN